MLKRRGFFGRVIDKATAFAGFRTADRALSTPDIVERVASNEGTTGAWAPRTRLIHHTVLKGQLPRSDFYIERWSWRPVRIFVWLLASSVMPMGTVQSAFADDDKPSITICKKSIGATGTFNFKIDRQDGDSSDDKTTSVKTKKDGESECDNSSIEIKKDKSYFFEETSTPSNLWALSKIECTSDKRDNITLDAPISGNKVQYTSIKDGEDITCTFTNTLTRPTPEANCKFPAGDASVITDRKGDNVFIQCNGKFSEVQTLCKSGDDCLPQNLTTNPPSGVSSPQDHINLPDTNMYKVSYRVCNPDATGAFSQQNQTYNQNDNPVTFQIEDIGSGFELNENQGVVDEINSTKLSTITSTPPGQTITVGHTGGQSNADFAILQYQVSCMPAPKLKILKEVDNVDNDQTDFDFSGTVNDDDIKGFSINETDTQESGQMFTTPGQYVITEGEEQGYDFVDVTCDGADPQVDKENRQLTVTLGEQDVTCTFHNAKQEEKKGSIKIKKETKGGFGTFGFYTEAPEYVNFSIPDITTSDSKNPNYEEVSDLPAGQYIVKENEAIGWDLTDLTCYEDKSGEGTTATTWSVEDRKATINLDAGENVTCKFTNSKQGAIIIEKKTIGGVGKFYYETTAPYGVSFAVPPLDTTNYNPTSVTVQYLPAGDYTVTEKVPEGWEATEISCYPYQYIHGTTAKIKLEAGKTVKCTYVNFKKKDDPMDEVTQLFVHRRVDNLLTHGPDRARLLRRLQDSQEQPTGSLKDEPLKFSGNGAVAGNGLLSGRMGLGSGSTSNSGVFGATSGDTGATYMHNGEIYHDGNTIGAGDRGSDYYGVDSQTSTSSNSLLAQLASQLTSIAGGTGSYKFSTSLSQLQADAQEAEQRRQQKLMTDAGLNFASDGFANRTTQMRQGLDVWVEGHISKYNEGLGGYDRDGDFRILYVGADYPIAPGVLIGALVQVDDTKEDVDKADLTGEVDGTGWMVGPYIGIKLADNLYFDARAAYGKSSNDIWLDDAAAGYRTGSFDTNRWLATATLTGNEYIGKFRFSPQFGIAYGREWYDDYYNALKSGGVVYHQLVEGRDISIARINATLEVGYQFDLVDGTTIEPHVSISGIANFSGDDLVIGGEVIDPNENRAKLEGGILIRTPSGWAFRAAGSYDGIGQDDFESYSGSLWVNVPLN